MTAGFWPNGARTVSLPRAPSFLTVGKYASGFDCRSFGGQLFLHITGVAGHDVVNMHSTFSTRTAPSKAGAAVPCLMHDANAWPADRYAGLPAPAPGEQILLWVQNSHPVAIPPGAIGLTPMGEERVVSARRPDRAFCHARCRGFGIVARHRVAKTDRAAGRKPSCARATKFSSGAAAASRTSMLNGVICGLTPSFLSSTPYSARAIFCPRLLMPRSLWQSLVLPNSMAVCQTDLPIAVFVYDPDGREVLRHLSGGSRAPMRPRSIWMRSKSSMRSAVGYGHVELIYDFSGGGEGDGWLHALFRYRHRQSGHAAETSFGAHVFNTILTDRDEPQSYTGRPPGLSTRLFLRLGRTGLRYVLPPDLSCVPSMAVGERHGHHPLRQRRVRGCALALGHPLLGLAALVLPRLVRGSGPRPGRGREPTSSCAMRPAGSLAITGSWAGNGDFSLDHMFGFKRAPHPSRRYSTK